MTTTATKSRPIIFTGENVLKIMRGEKTQTRRTIKPQPHQSSQWPKDVWFWKNWMNSERMSVTNVATGNVVVTDRQLEVSEWLSNHSRRRYRAGDLLYVKEGFAIDMLTDRVVYRADEPNYKPESYSPWKSPLFMPHHFSRLTLEITDVRVQRVNQISNEDAGAEGFKGWYRPMHPGRTPAEEFAEKWDTINGAGSWASDPWVWAITFRKAGK